MHQGIKNLTQGPINRQLFNLAVPIMATSFIQMAYSLTDMAWSGTVGSEAVAAIGSVGILTWMSGSISLLNKVGSEVSVGQSIDCAKPRKMPTASRLIILRLLWLFPFAGADSFLYLQNLSYVFMNLRNISQPMPFNICGLFLPDYLSFSFPLPSPEFIMQQDAAKSVLYQWHRVDIEYRSGPTLYIRFRTGNKRCGVRHLDCRSKCFPDFRLSVALQGMRCWAVSLSSPG